jgi:hypothetical protein
MNINSQIKEMTFKEKLATMELLWDELCHESKEVNSPKWHEDVLEHRVEEANIESNFTDWNEAKDEVRSPQYENYL